VARHGDRVLAKVLPSRKPGGRGGESLNEGEILEVIERGSTLCIGTLRKTGGSWQLFPDNARIRGPVRIRDFKGAAPQIGFKAVVELDDRMDPSREESGVLMEVLGRAGDPGVDILSIMRSHDLVSEFPQAVLDEAHAFHTAVTPRDLAERRDLREELLFTIDPVDARDFDDALSVGPVPGKKDWLRVGVHIADVEHFVKPGGGLDREALARGTSAYLVDRVVPMLPEHLTNDLCSLVPNQDRLAHTVLLDINTHGAVKHVDTFRSVIHSKQRLTYEQAQVLMDGGGVEGVRPDVRDALLTLARLTRKLRKARIREHALAFDMPEIRCVLDENGNVTGFSHKAGLESCQLVEECMLMANREVGALLALRFGIAIYRIHEEPAEKNYEQMADDLRQLGIEGVTVTRESLNDIISRDMPEPLRQAVTITLLKNMNRAVYSAELGEHFGLAFDTYTHFTSPIRRYPDLIAHRLLTALEQNKPNPYRENDLRRICGHCSEREREAADAESESHQIKRLQYYRDQLLAGKTGPHLATVSAATPRGILVVLNESGQRGLIPYPALSDDYYEVNATNTRATGRRTGRVIQLGDTITVHVDRVDAENRQMDLKPE
jgi:ribonuclease R